MNLMKLLKTATLMIAPLMLATAAQAASSKAQTEPNANAPQAEMPAPANPQASAMVANQVNINTASASELQKALVGIGAKKAEAIVQYRQAHGPFTSAEQLLGVQGIGKATLEKNRDRIQF